MMITHKESFLFWWYTLRGKYLGFVKGIGNGKYSQRVKMSNALCYKFFFSVEGVEESKFIMIIEKDLQAKTSE